MTDTEESPLTYRALDMLTGECVPKIKGHEPFWRPRRAPVSDLVRLPVWDWWNPMCPADADTLTMDVNAAYLAAASSVPFPHGPLEQRGETSGRAPGLYLTDAHPWTVPDLPTPLGEQPFTSDRVWVAAPTLRLLQELAWSEEAPWPEVVVYDSWTAKTSCRLRKWTEAVRNDRRQALDDLEAGVPGAAERYQDIKDGYSAAVQMMPGPAKDAKTKSKVSRPDWYQTIHAQHAASTWRKGWNAWLTGHGPVGLTATDEMTWHRHDLLALMAMPVPVIRFDLTGRQIGAMDLKRGEL